MTAFYEPQKLISATMTIKNILPRSLDGGVVYTTTEDEVFHVFLKKLVELSDEKAKLFAQKAESETIYKLANYVLNNKYKYNLKNVFMAINEYASNEAMKLLYEGWQDHYGNTEIQQFIATIYKNNDRFGEYVNSINLTPEDISWIEEKNVVISLAKLFGNVDELSQFRQILVSHGVVSESLLFRECEGKFTLVCSANAYMKMGDEKVASIYSSLNVSEKVMLLVNLLEKFSKEKGRTEKLDKFVLTYKQYSWSKPSVEKEFNKEIEKRHLQDTYSDWCARMDMALSFDGDPYRLEFWLRYQPGNVVDSSDDNILIINFGKYVVAECKGIAAGKMYLIDSDYYEREIKYKIKHWEMGSIKMYLNDRYDDTISVREAIVHRPRPNPPYSRGWWDTFEPTLRHYGIIPSK